jgi:hypothetical protein
MDIELFSDECWIFLKTLELIGYIREKSSLLTYLYYSIKI